MRRPVSCAAVRTRHMYNASMNMYNTRVSRTRVQHTNERVQHHGLRSHTCTTYGVIKDMCTKHAVGTSDSNERIKT